MKFPSNLSYFIRQKQNHKLPDIFKEIILNKSVVPQNADEIFDLYNQLKISKEIINFSDFGAGSRVMKSEIREVCKIAKYSSTIPKYGLLLNKIVKHFSVKKILELGTSLGFGTAYLATGNNIEKIISVDACNETLKLAEKNLKKMKISNLQLVNKCFDDIIDNNYLKNEKFNLIFIDGNHKGSSVLKYYRHLSQNNSEKSCIFIIDDINWSGDMNSSWKKICSDNKHNCCLDIFRMGLIFKGFNELPEAYLTIKFR